MHKLAIDSLGLPPFLLALAACLAGACASPSAQMAPGTAGAAGAGTNAVAAGALWAAGGGCKLQGCPYGSHCNKNTGFCDVTKCSDGCPDGTVCNEGMNRCQEPPPAQTPNDFLPQDSANHPPGQH